MSSANNSGRIAFVKSAYPALRMERTNPTLRDAMIQAATTEIKYGRTDRNGYAKRLKP